MAVSGSADQGNELMSNSQGRSLPSDLRERNLLTLAEVALHQRVEVSYFRDCIKALRNPALRIRRRIPESTLARLPLQGWFKRGNKWLITLGNLRAQLE